MKYESARLVSLDSGQNLAHFGQRSDAQLQGSIIIILLLADDIRDVGSICLAIRSVIGKILFVLNPAISTRASWEASTSATQADSKDKEAHNQHFISTSCRIRAQFITGDGWRSRTLTVEFLASRRGDLTYAFPNAKTMALPVAHDLTRYV